MIVALLTPHGRSQHSCCQRRGEATFQSLGPAQWEPRHIENLLFVEGLAREQGFGKQIKLLTMRAEKPPGLVVALADNLKHFGVDNLSRLLAERPRIPVPV